MQVHMPRYTMEEFAQRGQSLYERDVRPLVETGNAGKIVAIDIETGKYELGENTLTAADRLYAIVPDAQVWCVRIGHRAVHRLGMWCSPVTEE